MSTAAAARRLGVTEHRVRALIAAGNLQADKFAGRWVVDEASLCALEARDRHPGHRALSTRTAWGAAARLDRCEAPWLARSERVRLERLLSLEVSPDVWIARLRRRAERSIDLKVHPERMGALFADPRVTISSLDAAVPDLVGEERLNLWVRADQLADLQSEHGLLRSRYSNLTVRLLSSEVHQHLDAGRQVFRLIAAADLWEVGDARSREAATDWLAAI